MRSQRSLANQQGSILIGVLVLVVAMTLLGIALYESSVVEMRQMARTESEVRAFYAADAGIHMAALDVADPDPANPVGALTFSGVKGSLPADNTSLTSLTGFASRCFGASACDSSVKPYKPAFLVQARNDTTDPNRFWLVSTACTPGPAANPCPAGAKMTQVEGLLAQGVNTIPMWGAFGATSLGMGGNGAVADSYNSHMASCTVPCPYGGSNIGSNGDIGSNGSIDLSSTITINGDIINTTNVDADPSDITLGSSVQVNGNVQTGGTVIIGSATNPNGQSGGNGTGTTSQVTGTVLHDTAQSQVVLEPLPNCGGPFSDLTGKVKQYSQDASHNCQWDAAHEIAPTWKYGGTTGCSTCGVTGSKAGEFVAGGGACIAFAPTGTGQYCLGNVTFSGGTVLRVAWFFDPAQDAAVSLDDIARRTKFTVDGQFTLSGGGIANTTQLPQNFLLYSTYGNDAGEDKTGVTLSGGSDTYGVIYAPTTTAVISGGGDLYGSVEANKVSFTGGSGVHFDEYLPTALGTGTTNNFTIVQWKRIECGAGTFSC
jgi:hypothetical protein